MPTYRYHCPGCARDFDIFKRLADFSREERCSHCEFQLQRQILAPAVQGDYQGYDCPITGKWIEGRRAHEENLKRHGCRVLEAGEKDQFDKDRAAQEAALDSSVESTVEEFIEKLPAVKKERLANEVSAGMGVTFERR
jgi:putative FmdB family regulatory protein